MSKRVGCKQSKNLFAPKSYYNKGNNKVKFLLDALQCHLSRPLCDASKSRSWVFYKIGILKNFTISAEKHLCQCLFFNKVVGLRPVNFLKLLRIPFSQNSLEHTPWNSIKKRLQHRCFPVNFAKFLRTPFLQHASGRLLPLKKVVKVSRKFSYYFPMRFTCSKSTMETPEQNNIDVDRSGVSIATLNK